MKPKSNPCPGFLQAIALRALAWSKGFITSEYNLLHPNIILHSFKKVLRKLKSQFQVIFGEDFFPLNKISPRQASLLKTSKNCLLTIEWWNAFFTITYFTQMFSTSSCKCLVCRKIFLFCRIDSPGCLPWLFFRNHCISDILFHIPADGCRLLFNTSCMISSLIFLKKSFLNIDVDSAS